MPGIKEADVSGISTASTLNLQKKKKQDIRLHVKRLRRNIDD